MCLDRASSTKKERNHPSRKLTITRLLHACSTVPLFGTRRNHCGSSGRRMALKYRAPTSVSVGLRRPNSGRFLVVMAGKCAGGPPLLRRNATRPPRRGWTTMIRILIASFILAGSVATLATSPADAQSPDPALLAPRHGRAGLAPPIWLPQPAPQYTYPAPRPGGTPPNMTSRRGRHLSHPRVHGH